MRARWLIPLLLLAALPAHALDFRSVNNVAAIVYDSPSNHAQPMWVLSRRYPVEVIEKQEDWLKVRDDNGMLGWVAKNQLGKVRTLIVRQATDAHTQANTQSPTCAHIAAGVALIWLDNTDGTWAKVKLPDHTVAYILLDHQWGA